uniref:Peptidase S1 domain-containing protein n=1 Tax=Rattus norvegicus TaxID=10116 RepID=M0R8E3_RAT
MGVLFVVVTLYHPISALPCCINLLLPFVYLDVLENLFYSTPCAFPLVQSRIIGGWEWERHSQPWQVVVYHYDKWELTAAHCIPGRMGSGVVRLGQHSLDADEDTGQYVPVRHSIPHSLYNRSLRMPFLSPDADNSHDLMLCQLREPANTTEAVRVTEEPTEEAKLGSCCLASGWGSTRPDKSLSAKMLQCVDLTLMSSDVCTDTYSQRVTEFMLCAGHQEGSRDTCMILYSLVCCKGSLQGITSWGGNPCAYPKKPSIFTKVSKCMNWIKANIHITP